MIQLTEEFLKGRKRISKFVCLLTKRDADRVKWVMRQEQNGGHIFREYPDYHFGFNGWSTDPVALVIDAIGSISEYAPISFAFQSQEEMDLWLGTFQTT